MAGWHMQVKKNKRYNILSDLFVRIPSSFFAIEPAIQSWLAQWEEKKKIQEFMGETCGTFFFLFFDKFSNLIKNYINVDFHFNFNPFENFICEVKMDYMFYMTDILYFWYWIFGFLFLLVPNGNRTFFCFYSEDFYFCSFFIDYFIFCWGVVEGSWY